MQAKRSFYRPSHRFRNQVSGAYWVIWQVAREANPRDSESELESKLGSERGLADISNMLVVYIWTLFEVYMSEAYVKIHDRNPPDEGDVRKRNSGWGQMREWLIEKNMFDNLKQFDSLLGEFCARRNCLVHKDGKVDAQYMKQATRFVGSSTLSIGDQILTEWRYHMELKKALVNRFNLYLESEVEMFPRDDMP